MEKALKHKSKFLSLVLRHKPQQIDLQLDAQGWANIKELLMKANLAGVALSLQELHHIVEFNDKKRFSISEDGQCIRANQGHSLAVDLGLVETVPPELLFHGTAIKNRDAILREGLKPGSRQHVHLSVDQETAIKVGSRHGKPVVLIIQAGVMQRQGHCFYLSVNGVWLVSSVPPVFITI